jgi:PKD repeat protein
MKRVFDKALILMVSLFLLFSLPIGAENRTIDVGSQYLFEGSTIFFEVKGLPGRSQDLNWDFGDGTVKRGGRKAAHVYRRSGGFTVKVYERTDPENPVESRIRILKDNRRIVLPHETLIKGAPAKIEGQEFIDSSIWWDFGDGSAEQRGGRSMTHTYTRTGTFKIRAVDFDGDDTKKIIKKIRVREDNRSLVLPDEILEGEPVDITMRNGEGGHYTWEFSDGKTQTGTSIISRIFEKAGTVTVTIKDKTEKFPPLTKKIKVMPDNRQLKAETTFALPNESVAFDFLNFRGKKVKWNFGDGVVTQNAPPRIKHTFKKTGRYRVTAVDFNGKSTKPFTRDIRIDYLSPNFQLTLMEIAFDNGKYYKVTGKDMIPPSYYVKLKARGRGIIKGKWILDGTVIGLFETILKENQTAVLDRSSVVRLPVFDPGIHHFTLDFTNYTSPMRIPFIRYFVTEGGEIEITHPLPGEKMSAHASLLLKWRLKAWENLKYLKQRDEKDLQYEIAISKVPFQFLQDSQVQWKTVGSKTEYTYLFPQGPTGPTSVNDWVYWQVRLVDRSGTVLTTSGMASFKTVEKKE